MATNKAAKAKSTKTESKTSKVQAAAKTTTEKKGEARAALRRLTPRAKAEVVNGVMGKQFNGFVDFLREQSVVGLAIGLVLGTQAKQLVDSMVINFFNPFIGLFLPGKGTLAEQTFTMHFNGKGATFGYGALFITLINFIVVAAIVYCIFKGLKLDRLAKKKDADKDDKKKK